MVLIEKSLKNIRITFSYDRQKDSESYYFFSVQVAANYSYV